MGGSAQVREPPPAWLRAWFEAPGRPLWLVGLALAGVGTLLFGFQELLLDRHRLATRDANVLDNARVAVTHVVITAYLLTAYVYAERTTQQSIRTLLPRIDPGHTEALLGRSPGARAALALAIPFGLGAFLLVTTRISPGVISLWPADWTPEEAWHRVLGCAIGILAIRLSTLLVVESRRLSAAARAIRHLDLLGDEAIPPFARAGLTYALLVIGTVAAFALFLVDLRYLPLVGIVLASTLVVAVVALLLPLRGIRARIIQAKGDELRWCHEQMRERRARLASGAGDEAASLSELVAWEARIREVREWPLDASAFKRFGLYLLLPLGSWAGGALVERGIDALLD